MPEAIRAFFGGLTPSDGIALGALIVALLSLIVAALSFVGSWRWSQRSNGTANDANRIAREALELARQTDERDAARFESEQTIMIRPSRWDQALPAVIFEVAAMRPIAEVAAEYRLYSGQGGSTLLIGVSPGRLTIPLKDFTDPSELPTPGPREISARVRWRETRGDGEWADSGVWVAGKEALAFRRREE